ncbi:FimV/HubP family polar landmark protein [Marinospirillum insulare]|uniref:FimV/HubP family polar landmark protein n=1 Tax=Marinospirillum insulare TaxID=217169 RepID=UPI000489B126|nr:FimV/HubP family polar landmark protein [Marinospirillum insulare]
MSGVRSWLLAGLTAVVVAVPSISWSVALSNEELRTAYASTSNSPNRQRTIQVGPRDTLWSIARTTRPSNRVTIKQAMLAIRDANPAAFPTGNINEMEMGVRLVIPSNSAMTKRTAMQAEREVRRQNQAWVAGRAAPAKTKPVAQPKPVAKPQPVAKPKPPVQPPEVSPATTETTSQPNQQDLTLSARKVSKAQEERINDLENNLASSEENLEIAEREKDELAERISDMQQQVSTLQQLIQLKDKQLADMEEQLALEQAQPGASRTILPKAPEPQDLASQIKRQPELYGALAGSLVLLLILFFALLSARKKLKKANQQKTDATAGLTSAFAEDQASSKDFDLDLNAQPLEGLEELEPLDFDEELTGDLSLDDLDSLDSNLETAASASPAAAVTEQEKPKDPLEEAETFIAYGRLEQAAGFLQSAIEKEPQREDLRIKLLEVLVELNDEETFRQQQQQLAANSASAAGLARAEELASLFTPASTSVDSAETEVAEDDLGELDLGEMDLDELDDLDLIFPGEEEEEVAEEASPAADTSFIAEAEGVVDDSTDDLADIDSLEADLDGLIASKEPVKASPSEPAEEDLDFDELDETDIENLELELDLEKPLDEKELADQNDLAADFEPVDYKSDADDFMQALDSLSLNNEPEGEVPATEQSDPQQAPGVDEELAALNENFSELEAFTETKPAVTDDLSDLDDFGDLSELDDLGNLDDLGDLGDQDLDGVEDSMSTQLDLATAYIEMGDQEGARELLEKIAKEGDADLRATAQQMLETLSN